MTDDVELRSISVKLDGRESIEHQLDIHVLDLVESSHNPDIQLADVLAGIQYVVEYRILGGKMPNLSYDIMARLAEGLLAIMPKRTGSLLSKKFTPEANLSFVLFGQFLEEVEEFRKVVNEKSASDLLLSFVLHKRLEQEEITASFLSVVLKHCYQISDWRELVKEDDQDKIQILMEKYADKFKDPGMITPTEAPFPPQGTFTLLILIVLYFDKNSEKLAKMFSSDTTNGLPHNLVSKYREHYGTNKIPEPPKPSIIRMILAQFTDFMIVILLVVAIVDFFTDEVAAGVALVLVVILNATIGFTQELKAKKALDALTALHVPVAKVIRDGQTSVVDAAELVPGDLVVLDEGDVVPADMRLCEVAQLEVIEVILTGESLGVPKSTRTIRKRVILNLIIR
jgi:Ca2+-transporting ATPase